LYQKATQRGGGGRSEMRYVTLDIIRLAACLVVVVTHSFLFPHYDEVGNVAVNVFFVLSGFVLSSSRSSSNIFTALTRRALRLYPPAFTAALISWMLFRISSPREITSTLLAQGFRSLLTTSGESWIPNAALWSIPYEFYGSALVHSVRVVSSYKHPAWWRAVVWLLVILWSNQYNSMLIGAVAAMREEEQAAPGGLVAAVGTLGALGYGCCISGILSDPVLLYKGVLKSLGLHLAIAAGIVLLHRREATLIKARCVPTSYLESLARGTYACYILHLPWLDLFRHSLLGRGSVHEEAGGAAGGGPGGLQGWHEVALWLLCYWPILIAASALLYLAVEKPAMQLAKAVAPYNCEELTGEVDDTAMGFRREKGVGQATPLLLAATHQPGPGEGGPCGRPGQRGYSASAAALPL